MPVKQMAMTPVRVCPSNAFQHSAIDFLTIHMEGSAWQCYLVGKFFFVVHSPWFCTLSQISSCLFIYWQQFWLYYCPLIFSVENISHMNNKSNSQGHFNFSSTSTSHKNVCILNLNLGDFFNGTLGINISTDHVIYP